MSVPTLFPIDLGTYLGVTVDEVRAVALIRYAWDLCESIVTPLPAAGVAVVLDVASRAYTNPTAVPGQVAGPFAQSGAQGGLYLTRSNKATLRRLNGGGGAFTIETCPATSGANLPWWDINVTVSEEDGGNILLFDSDAS